MEVSEKEKELAFKLRQIAQEFNAVCILAQKEGLCVGVELDQYTMHGYYSGPQLKLKITKEI